MGSMVPYCTVLRELADEVEALDGVPNKVPDNWLTIEEASEKYTLPVRWFYDHGKRLPFVKHFSPKMVRVSERGMERYVAGL